MIASTLAIEFLLMDYAASVAVLLSAMFLLEVCVLILDSLGNIGD